MATHSSVFAWRIPGTREPGRLPSMGSHRVGHNWSDLAAAAASQSRWLTLTQVSNIEKKLRTQNSIIGGIILPSLSQCPWLSGFNSTWDILMTESVPPTTYLTPAALSSRWTVLKPGGQWPHSKAAKHRHLNPGLLELPLDRPGPFFHLMLGLTMEESTLNHDFSSIEGGQPWLLDPGSE